jgi:hypothetical protein
VIDYFLTAFHCIENQTVASTLEFFWFYQTASCNGQPPFLDSVPHTIGGADFLAGTTNSDFSFLRLRQHPPAGVTYMGWSTALPATTETLVCIEHPVGDYKRISFGNLVDFDSGFLDIQWSSGVTEEGSSGSPLFNASQQVIGQLWGGSSDCTDPTGIDSFGRFDVTYLTIQPWLDSTRPIFVPGKASFTGLFFEANGVQQQSSGLFTLKETSSGSYTASLQIGSTRYPFTGQLDVQGSSTKTIARRGVGPLTVSLVQNANGDNRITGTITDGTWTAQLSADPAVYDLRTNTAPFAGKYTLIIPGVAGAPSLPAGDGYGAVSVDASGKVKLSGALADGTTLTETAPLSKSGAWPLYVSLYAGKGTLVGWISLTNRASDDLNGTLTWIKPAMPLAKLYPAGFNEAVTATGSFYTPPPTSTSQIIGPSITAVSFADGDLASSFTNTVTVSAGNKIINDSTNRLSLSLVTSSGLLRGTVTPPGSTRSLSVHGALLQKLNLGYGYFLGPNQSGSVFLGP